MQRRIKSIIITLFCTLLTSVAQLMIKFGVNNIDPQEWITVFNVNLIIGGILYILAAGLFIIAIKHADLSLLYPLIATSFIWVTLLSFLFLNEPLNIVKGGGVFLIIMGVGLISRT